ncbi:hypothetical protein [Ruficoccus sp. ZRK36]|uniref:hypothetical protein n=1 Tax=Ruficoccus sp. ZRK36 TaxID=2866311 RepID=UPI001C7366B8|nr:hypothetical protein [Ruficoccus sp. ZRK36]QYY35937.1 hypothetical protein K0V07_00345 [Ruficoccus sp. ZRK36]
MVHTRKLLALCGAVLAFNALTVSGLLAGPRPIDAHRDRWEYEDREWTEPKVELNVQYRVPVVDTIGFLAVNYNEPQRLNQLLVKVRPISQRVTDLSEGTFQGRKFPAEVEVELDKLRTQMMEDVTAIYGAGVTQKVEAFLAQKYGALKGGILGGPLR